MARAENVELTVMCIVHDGNMLLLQNRVKTDWQGFAPPGGHVEKGESIVDAVIREMKEETGLTVKHPRLCGVKQFPIDEGRYMVLLFEATEYEGELTSSDEGEMVWIDRARLGEYKTVYDLKETLDVMLDDSLTEFQYVIDNGDWKAVIK